MSTWPPPTKADHESRVCNAGVKFADGPPIWVAGKWLKNAAGQIAGASDECGIASDWADS